MNIRDLAIKLKSARDSNDKLSQKILAIKNAKFDPVVWLEERYVFAHRYNKDTESVKFHKVYPGDVIDELESENKKHLEQLCDALLECIETLEQIASFREGKEVNSSFDEPGSAREARETLKKLGVV